MVRLAAKQCSYVPVDQMRVSGDAGRDRSPANEIVEMLLGCKPIATSERQGSVPAAHVPSDTRIISGRSRMVA